jgi:hypothetical protein
MGRIEGDKLTSQLTPTAEEIQKRMVEKQGIKSAASYSARALKKQQQTEALKGRGTPLGGAPPLDPKKMAAAMPRPSFNPGEKHPKMEVQEPPLARSDMVHPQPQDSRRATGIGAAYEVNQAIARGEVEKPVSMREAQKMSSQKSALSQESVEALRMASEAMEQEQLEGPPEEQPEISVSEPKSKKVLEDSEKDLIDLPFEFGAMHDARARMLSDKRRLAIEKTLEPLQIEDMVVNKEILQTITIVPDKLAVTLRTFNQREHLFCLRYVYKTGGSQLFVEEFLNTCKLTCSLFAVNGALLPEHRVNVGERSEEINEDKFEDKLFHLASFPVQLLADFSVQMIWFNNRVNNLLSLDNLKNG